MAIDEIVGDLVALGWRGRKLLDAAPDDPDLEDAIETLLAAYGRDAEEAETILADLLAFALDRRDFYFAIGDDASAFDGVVVITPRSHFDAGGGLDDRSLSDHLLDPGTFQRLTEACYETALAPGQARLILTAMGMVENPAILL